MEKFVIGISDIGFYICDTKVNSINRIFKGVKVDNKFIIDKIGIEQVARKKTDETTSDLCLKAYSNLLEHRDINIDDIGLICVCTQNGDYVLPHTSAVLHKKLHAPKKCAVFDINLGCSGYVYSINIVKSFMEQHHIKNGLLFTADPYSKILDPDDKNTNLIFGDAASVTLLSTDYVYDIKETSYYSFGDMYDTLIKENNAPLFMDGKMIFNFTLLNVPDAVNECLKINEIIDSNVDIYIMHQANKYMVNSIVERANIARHKVPYDIQGYGNTVSSSIPIILSSYINKPHIENIILCGFGVGLSIAAVYIKRVCNNN